MTPTDSSALSGSWARWGVSCSSSSSSSPSSPSSSSSSPSPSSPSNVPALCRLLPGLDAPLRLLKFSPSLAFLGLGPGAEPNGQYQLLFGSERTSHCQHQPRPESERTSQLRWTTRPRPRPRPRPYRRRPATSLALGLSALLLASRGCPAEAEAGADAPSSATASIREVSSRGSTGGEEEGEEEKGGVAAPPGFEADRSWKAKERAKGGQKGATNGAEMRTLLTPTGHQDPRSEDFVPREFGDDLWTFGKAHAVVNHILRNSPPGDPVAAVTAFDNFSEMHGLPFGMLDAHANVMNMALAQAMQNLFPELPVGRDPSDQDDSGNLRGNQDGKSEGTDKKSDADEDLMGFPGMNVLVMDAGLGGRTLHLFPQLHQLSQRHPSSPVHEVISLEHDPFLSSQSMQLLQHAIGPSDAGEGEEEGKPLPIRHLPFMPGEDTSLEETLSSLRDSYEVPAFHAVLLSNQDAGPWGDAPDQLQTLLRFGALAPGAVIHAEFLPGRSDAKAKMEALLQSSGGAADGAKSSKQTSSDKSEDTDNNDDSKTNSDSKSDSSKKESAAAAASKKTSAPRLTATFHDLGRGASAMVASVGPRRHDDEL